jgi:hypothetical protein
MTARFDVVMPDPADSNNTVTFSLPLSWDEREAKRFAQLLAAEYGGAELVVESRAHLARYDRYGYTGGGRPHAG